MLPILNALAWQMPYHAEHHLFPSVPFHRLPALHRLIGENVIVEPRGYITGQAQIIAMLHDPECQRSTSARQPQRRLL